MTVLWGKGPVPLFQFALIGGVIQELDYHHNRGRIQFRQPLFQVRNELSGCVVDNTEAWVRGVHDPKVKRTKGELMICSCNLLFLSSDHCQFMYIHTFTETMCIL
jgi:hypothetical protein